MINYWMRYALYLVIGMTSFEAVSAIDYSGKDIAGIEQLIEATEDADQGWRQQAEARIEALRKANLTLRFTDRDGKPMAGVSGRIELQRHQFEFGGAINARMFYDKIEGVNIPAYRAAIPEFFNKVGLNNALKYKQKDSVEILADQFMVWAKEHNLPVRGHLLVYPGWQYMHKDLHVFKDVNDPEGLADAMNLQVQEYAAKWDVEDWDFINETRDNPDVIAQVGDEQVLRWYHTAREHLRNPQAKLIINENRVISALPGIEHYPDLYHDEVQRFLDIGVALDGIGVQSRFKFDVTGEQLISRLNLFSDFTLPIYATEFEIRGHKDFAPTELDRARLTERIMTAYFSHPDVVMLMAWTLASHQGDWGLINLDGSLKLNGKMWLYLVKQRWHSVAALTSDDTGIVSFRGFKGDYQLTYSHRGQTFQRKISLQGDSHQLTIPVDAAPIAKK